MTWRSRQAKALALEGVVAGHFKRLSTKEVLSTSQKLMNTLSTASAFQHIERSEGNPGADKETLAKAARSAGLLAKQIDALGAEGRRHIPALLEQCFPDPRRIGHIYPGSSINAQQALASHLTKVASSLNFAAQQADPESATTVERLSGETGPSGKKKTKNTKTAADFFARECAEVYFRITGKKPTVHTDAHARGSPAGGEFLSFVRDAFLAVEIGASPETWARNAAALWREAVRKEKSRPSE